METKEPKLKWHTEQRKVNDLIPFEDNPRQMTEKQKEDLQKSLEKFDLVEIPAIDTDNKIVAGHQRLRIMQVLNRGEEIIDVRMPNRKLTDEEFREYNLRSNKNLGEWNNDLLANFDEKDLLNVGFSKDELDNIFGVGFSKDELDNIFGVGFSKDELDNIFGLETTDSFNVEEEYKKAIKEPKGVKKGDIWQLGEHKLIIGDSVDRKVWEKLLGEERFDFMFTDPPYKLAYAQKKKKTKMGSGFGYKQRRKYIAVEERGGVPEFDEWLSLANEYQDSKGANIMIFENWSNTKQLWEAMEKYWKIRNMVIWHTPNRCQGFTQRNHFYQKYDIAMLGENNNGEMNEGYEQELDDYLREKGQKLLDTNEVILYGKSGKAYWDKKKGTKWAKVNDHITSSVETGSGSGQSIIFGTKPIQILVPYIKILSPRDGIVVEPFAGSFSTGIACEIMHRKCRAIELSPLYGEVCIRRWEKFTGLTAKKVE